MRDYAEASRLNWVFDLLTPSLTLSGCQSVNATQKRGQAGSCATPSRPIFPIHLSWGQVGLHLPVSSSHIDHSEIYQAFPCFLGSVPAKGQPILRDVEKAEAGLKSRKGQIKEVW